MKILYRVYYLKKRQKATWKIKPFLSIFLFKKKNKDDKIFVDKKSAQRYVIKKQLETYKEKKQ